MVNLVQKAVIDVYFFIIYLHPNWVYPRQLPLTTHRPSHRLVEFDFNIFKSKLTENASIFFHDSVRKFISPIYGKNNEYTHDVYKFINKIKKWKKFQVIDFHEGSGVTLVKKIALEK